MLVLLLFLLPHTNFRNVKILVMYVSYSCVDLDYHCILKLCACHCTILLIVVFVTTEDCLSSVCLLLLQLLNQHLMVHAALNCLPQWYISSLTIC